MAPHTHINIGSWLWKTGLLVALLVGIVHWRNQPLSLSLFSPVSMSMPVSRQLQNSSSAGVGACLDRGKVVDKVGGVDPVSLIKCFNQTRCIQPVLQLKRRYKVYYCNKVSHGVRFFYLVKEGLLLHPLIDFVSSPEEAEVIVYLPESAAYHKSECNKPEYLPKLLVLDEGDGQGLFEPNADVLLFFKRSYVRRHNGRFGGYMGYAKRVDVLPMTYTIADAYVSPRFYRQADRDTEILCTLRPQKRDPNRARVSQWVAEYAQARGVKNVVDKQVNGASRTTVSAAYFTQMYRAQIIVTANPSSWEGDFRLCEALSSGALIFVDQMHVPRPSPLLHNRHLVEYDNSNKTDLFEKLDAYRADKLMARRVALNGYLHAMRHHRAANLILHTLILHTLIPLYSNTLIPLYSIPLYSIPLYPYTLIPLYPYTEPPTWSTTCSAPST